tara:strand:+ start:50 stop:1144 length:1095 start_codon:yes stop_codon:yes gene_type:complete
MSQKNKIYVLLFLLLFSACLDSKQEKIENIKLNQKLANELVSLSVKCVDQKYPYKIGYRYIDESWLKPHYELTPSFYGCWDWHSAVHGHWAMVKILKDFPEIADRDIILSKLDKNLSEENLNKEFQFFKQDFAKGFERTYGWAWLMKLYSELLSWDYDKAQIWANNMKPLVDLLSERTILFLDKLSTPLRPGTHANTAFSFSLMIEYSKVANDNLLFNKIKEYSIKNFLGDINCPVQYEPSGTDFLSPCLAEAALMSQILEKREFNEWLYKFLPSFDESSFGNIINPPEVLDPEDPGIGHLIGLMFHRAWTLKDIAINLEKNSDKNLLLQIAKNHSEEGYNIMFESGYGGEHWLATFAIYNFSK